MKISFYNNLSEANIQISVSQATSTGKRKKHTFIEKGHPSSAVTSHGSVDADNFNNSGNDRYLNVMCYADLTVTIFTVHITT